MSAEDLVKVEKLARQMYREEGRELELSGAELRAYVAEGMLKWEQRRATESE